MMPLPKILKNIIRTGDEKSPGRRLSSTVPGYASSPHRLAAPGASKTLSQINSLHSHRNLKPAYQMQLAESMAIGDTGTFSLQSCLQVTILSSHQKNCLQENRVLPYFIQYIESLESLKAARILKCFLQANCLMEIFREKFSNLNYDDDVNHQTFKFDHDPNQTQYYSYFFQDLVLLFNKFMEEYPECDTCFIDQKLYQEIQQFCRSARTEEDMVPVARTFQVFHSFWKCLSQKIEAEYYEHFLRSNFFLKYETEVLQSLQFSLPDILFASTAITSCFLEFMNDEGMKNHIDFLIMYQNFKTFSGQFADAVALYDRFFSPRSSTFLHVSDSIQTELRQFIYADPFVPTCFDRVATILIEYFTKTYFPQFKESRVFQEYLQNCDSKLAAARQNCLPNRSTLPSQPEMSANKPSSNGGPTTFCDPDLLWDRSHLPKGHLPFTYIDKYGRMNSSLEQPEPSPRSTDTTGRFSQFFRKISFNTSDEDKMKEDDAWRIAESIINDVCSVTIQHDHHNGNINDV